MISILFYSRIFMVSFPVFSVYLQSAWDRAASSLWVRVGWSQGTLVISAMFPCSRVSTAWSCGLGIRNAGNLLLPARNLYPRLGSGVRWCLVIWLIPAGEELRIGWSKEMSHGSNITDLMFLPRFSRFSWINVSVFAICP